LLLGRRPILKPGHVPRLGIFRNSVTFTSLSRVSPTEHGVCLLSARKNPLGSTFPVDPATRQYGEANVTTANEHYFAELSDNEDDDAVPYANQVIEASTDEE